MHPSGPAAPETRRCSNTFRVERLALSSDGSPGPLTGCTGKGGLKSKDLDKSALSRDVLGCAWQNATGTSLWMVVGGAGAGCGREAGASSGGQCSNGGPVTIGGNSLFVN